MTLLDSESAVYLCAMLRLVDTVTCGGQQYWTCACQYSYNTRDTGVVHNSVKSGCAQAMYIYRCVDCAQAVSLNAS